MDDHPGSVPVSVQYGGRNLGGYVDIFPEWAKCVSTVHDNVAQAEWLRGPAGTEALVSRSTESISQLRNRHIAEPHGRFAH